MNNNIKANQDLVSYEKPYMFHERDGIRINPIVSIIVPIYNSESTLHRCLKSLINQTYNNIEIILINDGSTDNSGNICSHYKRSDDRIRIINKKNGGVASARNIGLKYAKGSYVIFCDSDDYYDHNAIEMLLGNNTSIADFIVGGVEKKIGDETEKVICSECDKERLLLEMLENYRLNQIWGNIYKRNIIYSNKIFFREEMTIGEDLDWNCRYLQKCHTLETNHNIVYHYIVNYPDSLSHKFHDKCYRFIEISGLEMIKLFKKYTKDSNIMDCVYLRQFQRIWVAINTVSSTRCKLDLWGKIKYVDEFKQLSTMELCLKHRIIKEKKKMLYYLLKSPSIFIIMITKLNRKHS